MNWLKTHKIGNKEINHPIHVTVIAREVACAAAILHIASFSSEEKAMEFINAETTKWHEDGIANSALLGGKWELLGCEDNTPPIFTSLLEECELTANDGEKQLIFAIDQTSLEAKKYRDIDGIYYKWGPESKEFELVAARK